MLRNKGWLILGGILIVLILIQGQGKKEAWTSTSLEWIKTKCVGSEYIYQCNQNSDGKYNYCIDSPSGLCLNDFALSLP